MKIVWPAWPVPAAVAALLVVATAGLAGCKVDNAREAAKYRGVLDQRLPQPTTLAPGQVLTLREALAMANRHNERLALSGEDYLQSLIAKDRAASVFLPSVGIRPTYTELESFAAPSSVGNLFPRRTTDVPVNVGLHFSASDAANIVKADVMARYRLAVLLNLQSDILVSTAQTYYLTLQLERQIAVLENSVKVHDDRGRDMRAKLKAGTVRPLDVSQTEAEAAATRVSLVDARRKRQAARTGLAFLIGLPRVDNPLADEFEVPSVPALEALQTDAAHHRQDLLAATALVNTAEKGVAAAIGEYFPSISVDFTYFLSRQSFPPDSRWLFGASVDLPLFKGGATYADVRTAYSYLRQAHQYLSLTERQVNREVEVAYDDFQASGQRLKELQDEVDAARHAFSMADQAYQIGLGTNLERLIVQDRLLGAELQLAAETLNRKIFYLQLSRAIGVLVEEVSGKLPALPVAPPAAKPAAAPLPEHKPL
jgi:outer membrane protein TolC